MSQEPIIQEDNHQAQKHAPAFSEVMEPQQRNQQDSDKKFVEEVRIGEQTIFTLPPDMQQQQNNLVYRERKTRWGERQIKRSKIQEDAVFNPLEALYSGNSLLPITQYGQAELEIKLSLYSNGKRRKSKWHHQIQKTFTPPMMNYISPNISIDQIQYLLRLYRLDEITAKIKDFQPDDPDIRSPSPQPIYDNKGMRINIRQERKVKTLHRQRITLIEDCMKMRKTFVPPTDYKPLKKFKKIYLTQAAINDAKANYQGRIIGPGGTTQRLIENRSGCKIAVRGRGANKHQKDIFQNYQPLHILIVADTDDQLDKGVDEVQKILNGQEDQQLKAMQEDHMKQMVGIFNDNYCQNCQQEGHRTWACPFQPTQTKVNIKCQICGEASHPTCDCPQKQAYLSKKQADQINMLLQSQYSQFKSAIDDKPKGSISFITDFSKKDFLAIGASQTHQGVQQKSAAIAIPVASKKDDKKKYPQDIIEQQNLPNFDDD